MKKILFIVAGVTTLAIIAAGAIFVGIALEFRDECQSEEGR